MLDLQKIRSIIHSDKSIHDFLYSKYNSTFDIKVWNFWFVIIFNDEYVLKFYISKDFLLKNWINETWEFYHKELNNYIFFNKNNILTPAYKPKWEIYIWDNKYYYSEIENIRKNNNIKIDNFLSIDPINMAKYISKIHSLEEKCIHWNIHPSNFFITKEWEIWIFDLVSYWKGYIEADISRIFINVNFDLKYFSLFLINYWVAKININILCNFILKDIYSNSDINNKLWIYLNYYRKFKILSKKLWK